MQGKMQRAYWRSSYRRSIVGPLFLIGIGVVALLLTMHAINGTIFWQWYGRWWPLILIAAGLVMAVESLLFHRNVSARIRIGGGAILLGILLAIVGIVAAHNDINWTAVGQHIQWGDNVNLAQMFGEKHQSTEQLVHPLVAGTTVILQNPHGDVTVANGTDDAMHLTLDKTVYSNSDSDADRKMHAFEPLITSSGSVVTVHIPSSDSQTADLKITLPATIAVEIHANHGDVTVNGRQAAVAVNSTWGDVQLDSIQGPVHTTMRKGDFSANNLMQGLNLAGRMDNATATQIAGPVTMDGDFFGDVRLERLNGPAHFHSSRTDMEFARLDGSISLDSGDLTLENATGPVVLTTHAKDIEIHKITGPLTVHNSDGSIEVTAASPIGSMNIENRNGSVQVSLPSDAKFSVEATAVDGEVHTDFNLSTENENQHSIVSGSVGGGGPLLHLTAEKGDISLNKIGAGETQHASANDASASPSPMPRHVRPPAQKTGPSSQE